ncbi:MAG: hypothetical protein QE493_05950 [Verrucomicrobiae bacterium]|nr:hypothetical protein [Verrucomicrobiae bacterium]
MKFQIHSIALHQNPRCEPTTEKALPRILVLILSLFFIPSFSFAQAETAPLTTIPVNNKSPEPIQPNSSKTSLELLTPAEKTELLTAHQKALMDPAVQSTREITRMALHKSMLKTDPSIETILANMDAYGTHDGASVSRRKKSLGGDFEHWLGNFPAAAVASLTPAEKETLRHAHAKALLDPSVQEARKSAHITFYNAMINADPLIAPIMNKAGIPTPSSVQPLSKNPPLGSEEKILGGDFQEWGDEILAPAVSNQENSTPSKPPSSSNP